ncbi:MAG: addiction module protein [Myxococcota bacterium]
MTSTIREVLQAALALPVEEREQLVRALSDSLEPRSMSREWHEEIARRLQKIDNGEVTFHDAEQHLQSLRAKHG